MPRELFGEWPPLNIYRDFSKMRFDWEMEFYAAKTDFLES